MDLKAFLTGERPAIPGRGFGGLTEAPPTKPLIAAVEGYALAGGCEIALSCDLVVAADTAKFGLPEVKRGLVAAAGGLLRLPRRIPYQIAMELALTGEFLDAPRGYHFGLVNRLTAAGGALAAARELAVTISANSPLAVRATKSVIAGAAQLARPASSGTGGNGAVVRTGLHVRRRPRRGAGLRREAPAALERAITPPRSRWPRLTAT